MSEEIVSGRDAEVTSEPPDCVKGVDLGIIFVAAEINESIDSGRNI